MSKVQLIHNIDLCTEEDLEVVATLIDVVCWREVNSTSLINSNFCPYMVNIYLNGAQIEITELILLYEDEEIDFIALPPIHLPDSELADLFNPYSHIREFDLGLSNSNKGYIQLNSNLSKEGISTIQSIYLGDEESRNVSIVNLGKSFHFFTDKYVFGSLIPLSLL